MKILTVQLTGIDFGLGVPDEIPEMENENKKPKTKVIPMDELLRTDESEEIENVAQQEVSTNDDSFDFLDIASNDSESQSEVVEESVQEVTEPEPENTEEVEIESEPEVEEKIEESVQEEEKKEEPPKRGRKKRTVKKTEDSEADAEEKPKEFENIPFEEEVNIDNFIDKVIPRPAPSEKWDTMVQEIEEALDRIKIDEKINEGSIRVMLPILNNIYSRVRPLKGDIEEMSSYIKERISQQKLLNSTGSNAEERNRNAMLSCLNYKVKGQRATINLYDSQFVNNLRKSWVLNILDQIEFKRGCLLSYLSILKMENK